MLSSGHGLTNVVMAFHQLWLAACTKFAQEWDKWLGSGVGTAAIHRKKMMATNEF